MRNDPTLKLAVSLHANSGVYALLVGSGVSRAAGLLTSWEIVLDLIRKMTAVGGDVAQPDPKMRSREIWRTSRLREAHGEACKHISRAHGAAASIPSRYTHINRSNGHGESTVSCRQKAVDVEQSGLHRSLWGKTEVAKLVQHGEPAYTKGRTSLVRGFYPLCF